MSELRRIAELPEVRGAILSDPSGGLLDAVREPEAESAAAVAGFLASTLAEAGEELGLGALRLVKFGGRNQACLLMARDGLLTMAFVEPAAAVATVERAFEGLAQER